MCDMEIQNVSIYTRQVTLKSAQALADAIGSTAATLIEIDRDDELMGAGSDDRVIYRVKVSKSGPISIDDLRALVDVLSDAEQRD
jgi:hypothetical protein